MFIPPNYYTILNIMFFSTLNETKLMNKGILVTGHDRVVTHIQQMYLEARNIKDSNDNVEFIILDIV